MLPDYSVNHVPGLYQHALLQSLRPPVGEQE